MQNTRDQIIIVGAGIAGLSLAIQLAQKNIPSIVVEARESFGGVTSGVRISSKGVRVLEKMGVNNIGENTEKLLMYFGENPIKFDIKNTPGASPAIIVTRLAVFEKLRERVNELGIEIRYDFKLDDIVENAEGVEVISTNGQRIMGKYVVGADGVGSKVRKILNPVSNSDKRYAGYLGIGFIFPSNEKIEMSLHNNTNGSIGLASIGKINSTDNSTNNFLWTHIHMTEKEAAEITDRQVYDQITERAKSWTPYLQQLFEEVRKDSRTVIYHMPVYNGSVPEKWYSERMFLIGDAAHPYGPGGQGITMALMDAEALCDLLVKGPTDKSKADFQTARAAIAKEKGESAEDRNKPENQITSNFGLWWKSLFMRGYHFVKSGKMEL